jgi:hypothetical protein
MRGTQCTFQASVNEDKLLPPGTYHIVGHVTVAEMGNPRDKKKFKQRYEIERRKIELEEQLLNVEQKRLELEQRRIELELKKMKLPHKKTTRPKSTTSHDSSMPPILIRNCKMYGRNDDDESTAPTVSTQQDSSDGGNYSSSRLSGGESEGEEVQYAPEIETNTRIFEQRLTKVETRPVPASPVTNVKTCEKVRKSRALSETHATENAPDTFQAAAKRGQSMRELVSTRPSLDASERSTSLRELLTTTHTESDTQHDSCNRSTATFDTDNTKVTSNVSKNAKLLSRVRSYPSLTDDRSSLHSSTRNLGQMQNGEFVYTWPDGRRYDGSWKDGKFHGLGVHTWPNGGKYVGQYKVGLKHGYGVYDWSDGSKYEGQFANGKRNGQGAQLNANGTIYHNGLWKDDEPIRTPAVTA